ncbi:hypothetical protein A2U01_0107820 [Trifolium medium]|uniref:Uncharacterized protein n=1 Tax=Trifolium medium TaxID=97028 RepID=A0A392VGV0_9FABA|nr:hypothetical protein [Trifolium medium]
MHFFLVATRSDSVCFPFCNREHLKLNHRRLVAPIAIPV